MIVQGDKRKMAEAMIEVALKKRQLASQLAEAAERELFMAKMLMKEIKNEEERIAASASPPRNDREGDDAHE